MVPSQCRSGFQCHQISEAVLLACLESELCRKVTQTCSGCWAAVRSTWGAQQWGSAYSSCWGSPWPWGYAACSGHPELEMLIGNCICCIQQGWTPVFVCRRAVPQILSDSTWQSAFLAAISIIFIKLGQETLKHREVNWISQGSIESSGELNLTSLFASLQHKAADCCLHHFNISSGDCEQSMTFLFFLSYWRAQILVPWNYLSFWACLYKFSLQLLQALCCELILESPGRERSKSDQEEAGSPPVFMYKVFHIIPSSKKKSNSAIGRFLFQGILPQESLSS